MDEWIVGLMPKSTFNPSGVEFSMQFCNPRIASGAIQSQSLRDFCGKCVELTHEVFVRNLRTRKE
jgi:hypothetical protein